MQLNHINLCTTNAAALSAVFTRHFAFETVTEGADFAMLRGHDGFSLVITTIAPDAPQSYPRGFHLGFVLDDPAKVHAKHAELRDGGYHPDPIKTFAALGATWTAFYCPLGDGIAIEVNAHT